MINFNTYYSDWTKDATTEELDKALNYACWVIYTKSRDDDLGKEYDMPWLDERDWKRFILEKIGENK